MSNREKIDEIYGSQSSLTFTSKSNNQDLFNSDELENVSLKYYVYDGQRIDYYIDDNDEILSYIRTDGPEISFYSLVENDYGKNKGGIYYEWVCAVLCELSFFCNYFFIELKKSLLNW
jgi:hypothetical protein